MSYRLLGEGKLVFSVDEPPNCLSNAKWSALKIIYIQVTLSGLNRLCLCICAYTYTQKGLRGVRRKGYGQQCNHISILKTANKKFDILNYFKVIAWHNLKTKFIFWVNNSIGFWFIYGFVYAFHHIYSWIFGDELLWGAGEVQEIEWHTGLIQSWPWSLDSWICHWIGFMRFNSATFFLLWNLDFSTF